MQVQKSPFQFCMKEMAILFNSYFPIHLSILLYFALAACNEPYCEQKLSSSIQQVFWIPETLLKS